MSERARIIVILVAIVVGLLVYASIAKRRPEPTRETAAQRRERWFNTVDPRGNAQFRIAQEEAIRRWPQFVAAFRDRQPGHSYAVRAKFADGAKEEWMWVQVNTLDGDTVNGTLINEPLDVKNVKNGQRVTVAKADVDDWVIERDGRTIQGGFTAEATKRIQMKQRVRR